MIGQTIAHYKITAKLGSGGMGEVYLATDTNLDRKVAIKFLSADRASDPDARQRFLHEAKAQAMLSHANIATFLDVGEADGHAFLVMEYVEGKPLTQIAKDEKQSLPEILDLMIQVAEGLQAAHEHGIVHRDIKPENILVTTKRRVKITDFGLARWKGATTLTKEGTRMGTAYYMSPEQAEGRRVDHRSDIFSLGVVLYELVCGRRPFEGDTEAAIVYSVVSETPHPLARYCTAVPEELQRIVGKCLAKDPIRRYQHVDDMLTDLRQIREVVLRPSAPHAHRSASSDRRRLLRKIASVLVVVTAVTLALLFVNRHPSERAVVERRQLTYRGGVVGPEISPDGQYIVFKEYRPTVESRVVFVQDLAGGAPIEVFEDNGMSFLRWSPDGRELLMLAYNDSITGVVRVPRLGGSIHRYRLAGQVAWSPHGDRFLLYDYVKNRINFIDKNTGDTVSQGIDAKAFDLDWSPNGELLAVAETTDSGFVLATYDIAKKRWNHPEQAINVNCVRWSPSGKAIYFLKPRGVSYVNPPDLMKVDVNPHSGEIQGEPRLLISGLQTGGAGFSISGDGRKLVFRQMVRWSNLWLARLRHGADQSNRPVRLISGTSQIYDPSISPDGTQIAFAMQIRGEIHIFTMPIDGGTPEQITHTDAPNWSPAWSPDGSQIAYSTSDGKTQRIAMIDPRRGAARIFRQSMTNADYGSLTWAPGKRVVYVLGSNFRLLEPVNGMEEPLIAHDLAGWGRDACYSPDGSRVALISHEHQDSTPGEIWNREEVAMYSVEGHEKIWSMPLEEWNGQLIGWSQDGLWLYRATADSASTLVSRLRIADRRVEHVLTLPSSDVDQIAMSSDCSTFVYVVEQGQSDAWLVDNFDPEVEW